MRRSIRWRLSIYQVFVISLAMVAVALVVESSVRRYYLERLERHLAQDASLVQRALLPLFHSNTPSAAIDREVRNLGSGFTERITVIATDGRVLADSTYRLSDLPNLAQRPEVAEILGRRETRMRHHAQALRPDGMHVATPVLDNGRLLAVVRASYSLSDLEEQMRGLRIMIFGAVLLTTILAVASTLYVTRSIMIPIQEVTEAAQRMAAGDLAQRVVSNPDDETGLLTRSFNTMAARIQEMMGELDAERRKMAHVFRQMTDGLVLVDAQSRVAMMNPAAERILGISASACLGRPIAVVSPIAELAQIAERVLATGQEQRGESFQREPVEQALELFGAMVADRPGMPPGVMLVLQDWTDAWHSERVQREFVAIASHELRTPIAAVKMMAETLLNGAQDDPDVRTRFIGLMARESNRLSKLASDLLDLSQMESGQWQVTVTPLNVREFLDQAVSRFGSAAQERRQQLLVECPQALQVMADSRALSQILANLVENAVKYTPEGGTIRLSAWADEGQVGIAVSDTGIGIPPADLSHIFERFYRVDKARSRALGGTGLGLGIARHLVDVQGGRIEVASQVDKGSVFTVWLPVPGPDADTPEEERPLAAAREKDAARRTGKDITNVPA